MPSFDVVSKVNWHEVDNAVMQAKKEVGQRFDFRGTDTTIEKKDKEYEIRSGTEDRARAALDVLQTKLIRRKVSLKHLDVADPKPTSKGGSKIAIKVVEGIDMEKAKKIVAHIKNKKLKVQASIQGDQLRVTGKKRDDLQGCIQMLKGEDFGVELQYNNFRDLARLLRQLQVSPWKRPKPQRNNGNSSAPMAFAV